MRRALVVTAITLTVGACGGQTKTVTVTTSASAKPTTSTSSSAAPTTATSSSTAAAPSSTQPATTTVAPGNGPEASYCEDGSCATVHCPPPQASQDWICEQSTNPAARAAVKATEVPNCAVVAVVMNAQRDVVYGQDNCGTTASTFSVMWYADPGPIYCNQLQALKERYGEAMTPGTRLVENDAYLAEPVCAAVAPGSGSGAAPSWGRIARALSTEGTVASGATESVG